MRDPNLPQFDPEYYRKLVEDIPDDDFSSVGDNKWNKQTSISVNQRNALRPYLDMAEVLIPFSAARLRAENQPLMLSRNHTYAVKTHLHIFNRPDIQPVPQQVIASLLALAIHFPPQDKEVLARVAMQYRYDLYGGIPHVFDGTMLSDHFQIGDSILSLQFGFPHTTFESLDRVSKSLLIYLCCLDLTALFRDDGSQGAKIPRFLPFYPTRAIFAFIAKAMTSQLIFLYKLRSDLGGPIPIAMSFAEYQTALARLKEAQSNHVAQ